MRKRFSTPTGQCLLIAVWHFSLQPVGHVLRYSAAWFFIYGTRIMAVVIGVHLVRIWHTHTFTHTHMERHMCVCTRTHTHTCTHTHTSTLHIGALTAAAVSELERVVPPALFLLHVVHWHCESLL